MGKPEVTIQLGRPGRRRSNNIKKDLQEVGWGGMDWTDLAQDRVTWQGLVSELMNLQSNVKYREFDTMRTS